MKRTFIFNKKDFTNRQQLISSSICSPVRSLLIHSTSILLHICSLSLVRMKKLLSVNEEVKTEEGNPVSGNLGAIIAVAGRYYLSQSFLCAH